MVKSETADAAEVAKVLVGSVDGLILYAIKETPALDDAQLKLVQAKRRRILRIVDYLFLPPSFEAFFRSHRAAVSIISILSAMGVATLLILGHNRVSIIGQLFLSYLAAIVGSWCLYFFGIILARDLSQVFGVVVLTIGIASFPGLLWLGLSPFSPIQAHPKLASNLAIIDGNNATHGAVVAGEALLPPNTHLWVLVGRENHWWPLHEAQINRINGQWKVEVTSEELRRAGCEVTVGVVPVTANGHRLFESYLQSAAKPELSPSIMLPVGASVEQSFSFKLPDCVKPSGPPPPPHGKGPEDGTVPYQPDPLPVLDPARRVRLEGELADASERLEGSRDNPAEYNRRGLLYSDLGDEDAAEADFNQSILLAVSAESVNGRGLARLRKGRLEEAMADFRFAHNLDPKSVSYVINLEKAQHFAGHVEDAIKYFEAVLIHRPADGEVYFRLGVAYKQHGDLGLAHDALVKAVANGDALLKQRAADELRSLDAGK